MAQDIVPISLGLTAGDLVTLWAPRWREDGEEWEAFLGDADDLFAFPDVAGLVAFVRTAAEHDLTDHPAWHVVPGLPAPELVPADEHRYDLVGVPELVAEEPDTWVLGELADTVAVLRALADVCELDEVHAVLDAAPGFGLLEGGTLAFSGRDGERRWTELSTVVAERWDEVLDALDDVVTTPEVPEAAVRAAGIELAEAAEDAEDAAEDDADEDLDTDETDDTDASASTGSAEAAESVPADPALAFWSEVGIDPIRVVSGLGEHYTLRCYLDDAPLFLGKGGRIDVFGSPRALARHLAGDGAEGHDLVAVSTWDAVLEAASAGELEVAVDEDNAYVLTGLADDLAEGPSAVDPVQLDLAVELLTDAEEWAGSDAATAALARSEPLGWLVSFVLDPDPNRLAPGPPFDAEVAAWRRLVAALEDRFEVH